MINDKKISSPPVAHIQVQDYINSGLNGIKIELTVLRKYYTFGYVYCSPQ